LCAGKKHPKSLASFFSKTSCSEAAEYVVPCDSKTGEAVATAAGDEGAVDPAADDPDGAADANGAAAASARDDDGAASAAVAGA
jgi:hypothetical protein